MFYRIPAVHSLRIVLCAALVLGPIGCGTRQAGPPIPPSRPVDTLQSKLESDYFDLKARIDKSNDETAPSAWLMNSQHLFIYDDVLVADVIRFTRLPGRLQFLFTKVVDPTTSDNDLLVISEMLVYFGGHLENDDGRIIAPNATHVIDALTHGRSANADGRFQAPVTRKIMDAAEKARMNLIKQPAIGNTPSTAPP